MQSACPAQVPDFRGESHPRRNPQPVGPAPRPRSASAPASRSRLCSLPLLAFLGISVCVVLFLLQFSRIVQVQYDLASKTRIHKQLLRENAELQLRIEQLSALNRVEQKALQLGMVHPQGWQLLELPQLARQGLGGKMASADSHRLTR
jgi:cell division protein FtsL